MALKRVSIAVRARLIALLVVLNGAHWSVVYANNGPAHTFLTAPASNATTNLSNAAGLTRLEAPELVVQVLAFSSDSTFVQTADSFPGVELRDESDGSLVVPFLYFGTPLYGKWAFGISASGSSFGDDPADTGLSRYIIDEWNLLFIDVTPSIARQVTDKLSLGFSLPISYTVYEYEAAVFNPEPDIGDGRMEIEADGVGIGVGVSAHYLVSDRTRLGFGFRSETEPTLDDTPSFSGLGPIREALLEQVGILDRPISLTSTGPAVVTGGLWHELEGGTELSLDVAWIEFSSFGLSQVRLGNQDLDVSEQDFENVWAVTAGISYPVNQKWKIKAGALYTSQFIEDENRTFNFRMDRIWSIGLGAEYEWRDDRILGLNLNYYEFGDAPVEDVDENFGTIRGEFTDRYAVGMDFTLRWIFRD